jgi:pyruvate kinase
MRRAKILCTLGPSSSDEETIVELINAGMNAARLNFSHGTADDHRALVQNIRRATARTGQPVALLQDLQGPKIRVGKLPGGRIALDSGAEVTVVIADQSDDPRVIPCGYEPLAREVTAGDQLLLDDGRLVLRVLESDGEQTIRCLIVAGGDLLDHKGMNLPGVNLSTPAITDKDRADITLGRELGVDYVALSFVRRVQDVELARELVSHARLIAKIEKPEAINCIEPILDACDGVMVARGDLGVEMGPEQVPMLQKCVIEQANARGRLVITATEMLDSMRYNQRPTRAEVSDVANAVLDGTDAVMLSGETAVGAHPIAVVKTMARVIEQTEGSGHYQRRVARPPASLADRSSTNAVARAAVVAAQEVDAAAIICYTESGSLALMISEYRPSTRLIGATEKEQLFRQLALHWGVEPMMLPAAPHTAEETIASVCREAVQTGGLETGQQVVVATGSRSDGPSDLIKLSHL